MKKFYLVYQTTNNINGKIYVGKQATTNLNDGYLGSGIGLKQAIKKYGRENFSRTILFFCDTEEEAFLKEAELVNTDFVKRIDTYNIKSGGKGGWKGMQFTPEHCKAITEGKKAKFQRDKDAGVDRSEFKEKISKIHKGRVHTEETKKLMSEKHKGMKNSLGHKQTDEHKEKIRQGVKGRVKTPEECAAISLRKKEEWARKKLLNPNCGKEANEKLLKGLEEKGVK